jgi:hypothetical protein
MRTLDRYLGALLLFTFGYVILLFSGSWLRRGSFTFTSQGQSRLISSSDTPGSFYGYIIVSLVIAAVLLAWSVWAAVYMWRTEESEGSRPVGSLIAMRAIGAFFVVIIILVTLQVFR